MTVSKVIKTKSLLIPCLLGLLLPLLFSCSKIRVAFTGEPFWVSLGDSHSCILSPNSAVECWGANASGQLGLGHTDSIGDEPDEMGSALQPVNFGAGRTAKALASGENHTCALLDNNTVKCWGEGGMGQLGSGSPDSIGDNTGEMGDALDAVKLGTGRAAKAVTGGDNHTCALLDNDTVKCWGANGSGQLGQGDMMNRGTDPSEMGEGLNAVELGTGRTAKMIAAGASHTCALLDDNTVKCWGANGSGQLGQGDNMDREAAPDEEVNLGTGRSAKMIAAGGNYACAILDDSSIKCWGDNSESQLGLGDTIDRGTAANQMGDDLPAVNLGTGRAAKRVVLGTDFTCAILDNDTLKCWGLNDMGQLGQGDMTNRGTNANQMGDDLNAIELGTGRTVHAIEAGAAHTCVLLDDDSVKCWGANGDGQLGLGDTDDRGDAPGEMGDMLAVVGVGRGPTGPPGSSPDNPILISTYQELNDMRNDLTAHYKLAADIDAVPSWNEGTAGCTAYDGVTVPTTDPCTGWVPVGDRTNQFTGSLDGNGYIISNLYIYTVITTWSYSGLFALTSGTASIRKLGLVNVRIATSAVSGYPNAEFHGGLVGLHNGSISDSSVTGTLSAFGRNPAVGGLVGRKNASATISNSYAAITVSAISSGNYAYAGGITGESYGTSHISNCYATGTVLATATGWTAYAGGLGGLGGANNSYARVNVSLFASSGTHGGGLTGDQNSGTINNSYATGTVSCNSGTCPDSFGGLMGKANGTVNDSYWDTTMGLTAGCGQGTCPASGGLTTAQMQAIFGTYPDMLGPAFQLNAGQYPKLYKCVIDPATNACNGSSFTTDLLPGQ